MLSSNCYLDISQVMDRTGIKKTKIHRLIKNGSFPLPIRFGHRTVRWLPDEIDRWISKAMTTNVIGTVKTKHINRRGGSIQTATRLLSISQVKNLVGLSRFKIYQLINDGLFPREIRLGPRTTRWKTKDIDRWINNLSPTNVGNVK